MHKRNALIVEKSTELQMEMARQFRKSGYSVRTTCSGDDAIVMLKEFLPEVVIVDWYSEDLPGIDLCRHIRRNKTYTDIAILMTCASNGEEDLYRAFDTGADDFIRKPINTRALVAKASALLRCTRPLAGGHMVRFADVELDPAQYRARRNGRTLNLSPKEYLLLAHFIDRPRRIHSRNQLIDAVWGMHSNIGYRTIDVAIQRLRVAMNNVGERDLIRTVPGSGYSLDSG